MGSGISGDSSAPLASTFPRREGLSREILRTSTLLAIVGAPARQYTQDNDHAPLLIEAEAHPPRAHPQAPLTRIELAISPARGSATKRTMRRRSRCLRYRRASVSPHRTDRHSSSRRRPLARTASSAIGASASSAPASSLHQAVRHRPGRRQAFPALGHRRQRISGPFGT